MLNLRSVYRHAEEHTALYIGGLFLFLAFLILLQTIFSPTIVIALVFFCAALFLTIIRPLWILGFLAVYLPFESLVLKFTPEDAYVLVRYASELLVYVIAAVILVRVLVRTIKIPQTPLDLPFVLFVVTLLASTLINLVAPSVAILGMRQILRFILVFFLVIYLKPSKKYIQTLTMILFGIVLFECGLGFLQSIVGERLDLFLLPSDARSIGDITLTSGVTEFWDPGSRIFATLGRYDRLGNFLYLFLLMATGFLFVPQEKNIQKWLPWIFAFGSLALVLTYSRASWFAFLLGFLFIGLWIKRDRRVAIALASFVIVVLGYMAITGISVSYITEAPGQTLIERFYESFSYARWASEYYGLGRVYWDVQTPLAVVPHSPFFGVGPGQFGGGAVAALHNTKIYDALGLPFGVYGTEGFIDNNWFAVWGEVGTIGFALFIWMFVALFRYATDVYRNTKDPFTRALAIGFAACVIGVAFNAFTSTVFEIRTLAFYFWMYGGFVVVLAEKNKV
ncbi:MAG: O-antigen ligase family protein [Candidatus Uhrbacteria bacterium]|nr:O-antigen ligase family protein [Candidatus Uhrbacteria bacterium]